MYGFVLKIPTALPRTVWACRSAVNDYSWKNSNTADMIEISVSDSLERTVCVAGREPFVVKGRSLSCLVGDVCVKSFAETGITVEITSVAVCFDKLSACAKEFDENDINNRDVLLIPYRVEDLNEKELAEFETLLLRYIHSYVDGSAASKLECSHLFLDLLCRLDSLARRSAHTQKDKYVNYYVMKADSKIKSSYTEKLTLQSIADSFGITPSYLSLIYKRTMGVSFSDRLFEIRIEKAKELLSLGTLSIAEIAELSGLGDESNLRKRFKSRFGISVREYRSINKEQTLYHKKPQRQKD